MSLLTGIAGVTTVVGCGGGGGTQDNQLVAYGAPSVAISGKITKSDGTPVKGLEVSEQNSSKVTYSGADGTYSISLSHIESNVIIVSDVDGVDNGGEFATQTIDASDVDKVVDGWVINKHLDIVVQPKSNSKE